jgi:hypothetical protein
VVIERRPASKGRYLAAAVITAVIFLLGMFVGFTVEGKRVNVMQDMYVEQQVKFASSQLQYSYVSGDGALNCPALYTIFYSNIKDLDLARIRLENFRQDSKINTASFDLLKREYTLEELRYWMLADQARKVCGQDIVRVLYFYSTDQECPTCSEQGFVLDYLKKLFGDRLLIFALDSQLDEPMVGVLMKQYNVTSYPGIVIEREQSSNGFVAKDALLAHVCGRFNETPSQCPAQD